MTLIEFTGSPDLAMLTLLCTLFAFVLFLCAVGYLWSRLLATLNILKHGWPPPHCDANGDAVEETTRNDTDT